MESYDVLEKAFTAGFTVTQPIDETTDELETLHFQPQTLGGLNVQTGRVIAADALASAREARPFVNEFPHGEFPVELAVARYDDGGNDERVAFARIKFSDAPPARWEGALSEGEDPSELEEGELFGYGVDSGRGAFLDTRGQAELVDFLENEADPYDQLEDALEKSYRDTRDWLLWQRNGATVAFFSSGLGDGFYPSFIGYDADGAICRLVTDFGLVEWES